MPFRRPSVRHAVAAWAAGCAVLVLCCGLATGQERSRASLPAGASRVERLIRSANAWDANHDQVYTCDEWKKFVGDIFTKADRNRDGFVDAGEFEAIRNAFEPFKDASLGYFDDNGDRRLSRAEFVDKPNPFFLQFDVNRDCSVTLEEIMAVASPQVPRGPAGSPGGGMR